MDTGKGYFEPFDTLEEFKNLKTEYGIGSVFKVGEEVEIKDSRFRISKIIRNGLKLELLPNRKV